MRSTLITPFWRAAYQSLPETVRRHHLTDIERAERWELAFDAAIEILSRAKGVLARLFSAPTKPRSAHCPFASPSARPEVSSSSSSSGR